MNEKTNRPTRLWRPFPHLSLGDVHAALVYSWDHKEGIDRQVKKADEFVKGLQEANGVCPLAL